MFPLQAFEFLQVGTVYFGEVPVYEFPEPGGPGKVKGKLRFQFLSLCGCESAADKAVESGMLSGWFLAF